MCKQDYTNTGIIMASIYNWYKNSNKDCQGEDWINFGRENIAKQFDITELEVQCLTDGFYECGFDDYLKTNETQKIVIDITDSDAHDFLSLASDEYGDTIEWSCKSDKGCMIDVEFINTSSLDDD